jgi:L-seryl-tRNA(Ser) seleniumtransferase
VIGFVHAPTLAELAEVARARGLPLIADLGSGSLLDTSCYGLAREPLVQEVVAAGADLVCFSGDKLLGGPQAGILVGKAALIARLKRHPLTRAIRPDKATLAALGATLIHFALGEAEREVPVWRMIAASPAEIETRATSLIDHLGEAGRGWTIGDGRSAVGGGSLPGETLATRLVLSSPDLDATALAAAVRSQQPAVVARIERDRLVLDLRTVLPEEDATLARVLRDVVHVLRAASDAPGGGDTPEPLELNASQGGACGS